MKMNKILGTLLIAFPFIAIALLPLYSHEVSWLKDVSWSEVGVAFGIAFAIVGVTVVGVFLLMQETK